MEKRRKQVRGENRLSDSLNKPIGGGLGKKTIKDLCSRFRNRRHDWVWLVLHLRAWFEIRNRPHVNCAWCSDLHVLRTEVF